MAYQGDKTLKELLPPGHPFLQPRIVFGMKPPLNGSSESKPGASSAAQPGPSDPEPEMKEAREAYERKIMELASLDPEPEMKPAREALERQGMELASRDQ